VFERKLHRICAQPRARNSGVLVACRGAPELDQRFLNALRSR
jgi:hypothetical protein